MKEIIQFLMKGWLRSKYLLFLPIAIIVVAFTLLIINSIQSGATKQELQETFDNRKESVHLLISSMQTKDRVIGLTSEEQQALQYLLEQELYVKDILTKVKNGDLDIAAKQLAYITAYEHYVKIKPIPYLNESALKTEALKAKSLLEHDLSYSEQVTPYKTALFTKQLFQILFSPITAFLLLLIFSYKYIFDRENRTFDFFKINSLSSRAIYIGYLLPLMLVVIIYSFIASLLALLPPLLTGNVKTLFYPVEVALNADIVLVPVWKWLVYIPISWGIFMAFLLVFMMCLMKQRANLGVMFSFISLPIIICYMIYIKLGFHIANPIHLIVSYDADLLATNQFGRYLLLMLSLFILCCIIAYGVIKTKNIQFHFPTFQRTKKQQSLSVKFKLLQFEHLKKKRKGHIIFMLMLLLVSFGGTVIVVNQQFQTMPIHALKAIERYQNQLIQDQAHWEIVAAEFELEEELQKQMAEQSGEQFEPLEENPYSNMIKGLAERFEVLERVKKEIYSPHFSQLFRETMSSLEFESYKEMDSTFWNVTFMASEEQKHVLNEKELTPWPIGDMWISNFDAPERAINAEQSERLKLYEERNMKYGNSSLFTIYKFLNWNVMLPILLLFVLLLWTTMSDEYGPTATIHFLKTKPIRSTSIYVTKWAYNLMIACSLLLISGGIIFLIATLIGGLGEAQYPIVIYAKQQMEEHYFFATVNNAYFSFESLGLLLIKSGILIFAQIFFLNSLFSIVGRWMKNHYATNILTCIIVIAGFVFGNYYIEMTTSVYNPFIYFDTWNIIDGWKSIEAQNSYVNFVNGTVILLVGGTLLFGFGFLTRRKVTR